jgi:acylpyruvate hydrolase
MKIICVGRNYAAHAKELNNKVEEQPVIFMKPETALIAPRQPFFYPDFSNDVHHEVEIVVRINKAGKRIAEKFANKYFDEITVGIDFTARDVQQQLKTKGLPWELAKAFDSSAPVGNFISKKKFEDIQSIPFSLKVNGTAKQEGNTQSMIFSIHHIISFVSHYITLKKGDFIFTGTPEGVAAVKKGDHLEAFIGEEKLLNVRIR